ncbi:MAG: hypothetical protein H6812_06025 [Phycisphaeraceae bacterium]|nr:hypothetical protein [Phycisphaerales bacterium]MCB9842802.1 hypothetical protein [Phycisphaeraceae bacterium]
MPTSRRPANDALLCEHCGYDLAGLTRNDNCPECGKPIAESLPENRTGTPWQRRVHWDWLKTAWFVVRHPYTMWRTVQHDDNRAGELIGANALFAAGSILPAAWVVLVLKHYVMEGREGVYDFVRSDPRLVMWWVLITLVGTPVIYVLTATESFGIAHFGRRRGWRTNKALARVITSHASIMWFAAAPLGAIGGLIPSDIRYFFPLPMWIGFFLGMLLFETWVYLGFRAMRYANPSGAERHLRDHAGEANISTEPESARRM